MRLRNTALLLISLFFSGCQSENAGRIQIRPHLDIPRFETIPSEYVDDLQTPDKKYRIVIFEELFPNRNTPKETQKRVLENYIQFLEKSNWESIGTQENTNSKSLKIWKLKSKEENCDVTIKLNLVDYYKEIGDAYFGVESHDRIEFQLFENLSKSCRPKIPATSLKSSPPFGKEN